MLDIMSPAIPCLDLHVCMHVLCSYAYIYAFTCLYAWVCILLCLYVFISTCLDVYPYAYMRISMLICVDRCVYMLRLMFYTYFMPSSMCLPTSCHVYVLRPRPCFVIPCAIVALLFILSHFLMFWPNG